MWTCTRQNQGQRCGHVNENRHKVCRLCAKKRPARRRPAHLKALELSYEDYVAINGGTENCGVCGAAPKPGKRHHRDHDHRSGRPRGLACFRCNSALRPYMTEEWLRSALAYLERAA